MSSIVPLLETTKASHRNAVKRLGGRCPCCGLSQVIDSMGHSIGEYDHFYSRERREFHETWLICETCHSDLTTGRVPRSERLDAFKEYQRRAKGIDGGTQAVLPFSAVAGK